MIIHETLQRLWPTATDEQYDDIVWTTTYPLVPEEMVVRQLEALHQMYGDDINKVLIETYAEITRAWNEYKAKL